MAVRKIVTYFASPKRKKRLNNIIKYIRFMTELFEVKTLEEMPKALNFLIKKVDNLQETVNTLRHKQQASESPRWMNIDELCAYHPSHPKKQTVYEWVSKKTIPYHKMTKGLMFLQSEIDEWLKRGAQKSEEELLQEAKAFVLSKKGKEV
jgi:predicted DNA-binding transcriptional regulator AlpA